MPASFYQDPQTLPAIVVQYAQPTTGATVNINSNTDILAVDPAGLLLTLTVALPSSPRDGKIIKIAASQVITTLTLTGSIVGSLTTLALGGFAEFVFCSSANKWFRAG